MEAELDEKEGRDENGKDKSISVSRRLAFFYTAPVTKFYCNMIFYMCFPLTFTYMVLSELPEDVYYIEWILASVVLSITSEEIRQLAIQEGRISSKVKDHLRSLWNWMDLTGIFFFWLPFVLRFVNLSFSEDVARLFYILDLFFWFMRVLNNFAVNRKLGPVVTIILNMIPILVSFSFVWIVFMAAFGIISKAVSFPQRFGDVTPYDIINVISFSYWQSYGNFFLETFQTRLQPNQTCTQHYSDNSELPPCPFAPRLSIYFLAIFMLIGNVLLMNLLIAMFSSVYEKVNSRAQTDWKNKRMSLIVEYHHRPVLPPPFVLIEHLYYLFTWNSHSIKARLANGLTVEHEAERLQELVFFEEKCKYEYLTTQRENNCLDISLEIRGSEKRVQAHMKVMEENMGKQLRGQAELLKDISEQLNEILKKNSRNR